MGYRDKPLQRSPFLAAGHELQPNKEMNRFFQWISAPAAAGIVRVDGHSMSPSLSDGDYLFIVSPGFLRFGEKVRKNDIVAVNHPTLGKIIKRVCSITEGGISVAGDNRAESTSADAIGVLSREDVTGRVLFRIKGP